MDVKVVCVVVWWMHKVVTMVDVKVIGMVMIMVARKVTVVNAKLISMADVQRWLQYQTQRCFLMAMRLSVSLAWLPHSVMASLMAKRRLTAPRAILDV